MRRSRFVAREFATLKRDDTYSPATGSHSANLVPLMYLRMLVESMDVPNDGDCGITLAALGRTPSFRCHKKSLLVFPCMTSSTSSSATFQDKGWEQNRGTVFPGTMCLKLSSLSGASNSLAWHDALAMVSTTVS